MLRRLKILGFVAFKSRLEGRSSVHDHFPTLVVGSRHVSSGGPQREFEASQHRMLPVEAGRPTDDCARPDSLKSCPPRCEPFVASVVCFFLTIRIAPPLYRIPCIETSIREEASSLAIVDKQDAPHVSASEPVCSHSLGCHDTQLAVPCRTHSDRWHIDGLNRFPVGPESIRDGRTDGDHRALKGSCARSTPQSRVLDDRIGCGRPDCSRRASHRAPTAQRCRSTDLRADWSRQARESSAGGPAKA